MKVAIIVSDLPAHGKTTVGKLLAKYLNFNFLDKDDFLEAIFEECGRQNISANG